MARVVLVVPPAADRIGLPLLSIAYLTASLLEAGHDPIVLDAAASVITDTASIVARIDALSPDIVGIHCKTSLARAAYEVARSLRGPSCIRVAGGPHATALPDECLANGFDVAAIGEAEQTMVDLADAIGNKRSPHEVAGLRWARGRYTLRAPLERLDELPSPFLALERFDPLAYPRLRALTFGGVLASRGCPHGCTFCSNQATGRRWRSHGVDRVAEEVLALRDRCGQSAFMFYDDAFGAHPDRREDLCARLRRIEGISWICSAHPSSLDGRALRSMRDAGCCCIDLGIESGSDSRLQAIRKGARCEQVLRALERAREVGIAAIVNIMFGWPDETVREIDETLAFMDDCAERGARFNARGVLIPMPGTLIYEQHHERHGFTAWWLAGVEPFRASAPGSTWEQIYADDPALECNFFEHSPAVVSAIRVALLRKAELTKRAIAVAVPS